MAVTFFTGLKCYLGHSVEKTLFDTLNYGKNKRKTDNERLVTSFGCDKSFVDIEMRLTQKQYEQRTGKAVNRNIGIDKETGLPIQAPILYYLYQSFPVGEADPDTVHEIGVKLIREFIGEEYQHMVCTHIDKGHIHNHIYFNSVSVDARHKYNISTFDYRHIREISDKLCREYGLSVVIPGKERRSQNYSKCKASSFRDELRNDIDTCTKNAKSYDEFLKLMEQNYIVDISGKHLKFLNKENGQQRFFRSYSLGEDYTEEALRSRFTSTHQYKKINLSFADIIKARGKRLTGNAPLTYTQKMKNIKAMLFAVGVANENSINKRHNGLQKIANLQNEAGQVKQLLANINETLLNSNVRASIPADLLTEYSTQSNELMSQLLQCQNKLLSIELAMKIAKNLRNGDSDLVDYSDFQFIQQKNQKDKEQDANSRTERNGHNYDR